MTNVIDFEKWKNGVETDDEYIVRIHGEALDTIRKLAKRKGVSNQQVLSDALSLELWCYNALDSGGTILMRDKKGQLFEISFRR